MNLDVTVDFDETEVTQALQNEIEQKVEDAVDSAMENVKDNLKYEIDEDIRDVVSDRISELDLDDITSDLILTDENIEDYFSINWLTECFQTRTNAIKSFLTYSEMNESSKKYFEVELKRRREFVTALFDYLLAQPEYTALSPKEEDKPDFVKSEES